MFLLNPQYQWADAYGGGHPTTGGSLGPLYIHKLCHLSLIVKGSLQTLAEYSFSLLTSSNNGGTVSKTVTFAQLSYQSRMGDLQNRDLQ